MSKKTTHLITEYEWKEVGREFPADKYFFKGGYPTIGKQKRKWEAKDRGKKGCEFF